MLEIHLGIRLDVIETVAKRYVRSLPEFQEDSLTLVVSMGRLQGQKYLRFKIKDDDDLEEAYESINTFLDPVGFSVLEGWADTSYLHQLFNSEPSNLNFFHSAANKAIRGLILAKLNNAEQFDEIRNQYWRLLKVKNSPNFHLEAFKQLNQFLEYYSQN